MFKLRPYERDTRVARLRIEKIIDEAAGDVPIEIIVSALLSSVTTHLKRLVDEDQREVFSLALNEYCNDLESISWIEYAKPKRYLEIMHRYDRRYIGFQSSNDLAI